MKLLLLTILLTLLAACAPAIQPPTVTPSLTPSPTQLPTASATPLPTPFPTSTSTPVTIAPTVTPTRPGETLITPDGILVERWEEYQTALAKSVRAHLPPEEVLCEWDILGRSGNDVYVWAVCRDNVGGGSVPAIIHLDSEGAVLSVERAKNWSRDIPRLFPPDVIEKFAHYHAGRAEEMREHIEWRRAHPDEPPLIVLLATPTP